MIDPLGMKKQHDKTIAKALELARMIEFVCGYYPEAVATVSGDLNGYVLKWKTATWKPAKPCLTEYELWEQATKMIEQNVPVAA